eukprot:CAMPEP_0176338926 /NCGR_PEP_ID=MMETSP0126-20121128/347_1 /TAXON_ID=141414 ORGANISM="Strombidinopsis acuminatum, Strain SPMC142" /NCGR_SAMPLE_ID=MMETSP0126 /ASSEMBLY_ACC=CAM_ASM_000229 /LENGTH=327 /DNA_ID=CAMNT_0017682193 /DNA_START=3225 /DNA_END=4208 /DNA_ORIENTATION=+
MINGTQVLHLVLTKVGATIQVMVRAEFISNLNLILDGVATLHHQTTGVALAMLWVLMTTDQVKTVKVMEVLLINVTNVIKKVILQEIVLVLLRVVVMLATNATKKVTLLKTALNADVRPQNNQGGGRSDRPSGCFTVVSKVTCLENALNLETKEAPEVVEEEDQMEISVEMVRIQVPKNATDVINLVTLQENVLMLLTVMTEVARVTKDNDVMMVALIIEKVVLMTTTLVQLMYRQVGAVATTLVKAGTVMKILTCSRLTTILLVATTGVLFLNNKIKCHRTPGPILLTTMPIRATTLAGALEHRTQLNNIQVSSDKMKHTQQVYFD